MSGIYKKPFGIIELEKRQMLDAALGSLASTVVFGEQLVNSAPQTLDADVSITGSTVDFSGLDLNISTNGGVADQLNINNEGNGAGQIGVSGTSISYSGVQIGTLTSNGQNGANLTIELNGNANMTAIENLVEAINYANASNAPVLSRTINFALEGLFSENMTVTIAPFNDAPVINANTGLTVAEGTSQTLTNTALGILDGDSAASDVDITITSAPGNGRLELTTNAGVAITTFTLADLNSNLVRYVHNGSETLSDSFTFTVADENTTLAAQNFSITVTAVNDAPVLAQNDGAEVFQGFTTDIGGSEIPTQFGTEILRQNAAGTFASFHGTVNGNVNTQISLIFTTPATIINSNPGQVLFETGNSSRGLGLYLNNQNQLALFAGPATSIPRLASSLTLETSTQYAVVVEISATGDQIRLHYAQAGNFDWFEFGRAAEDQINNWTDTTIANNNGSGYGVVNNSRGGFNGTVVGASTFAGTLDSPLIVTRFPATTTTFVNTNLVFSDVDTTAANIVYTITDNVDYGTLYRNGIAIGLGDTFTQADLNNALIKYTHNNTLSPDDSFGFSVSDGVNIVAGNTYAIDVNTANNTPDIPDQALNVSEDAANGATVGTIIATDPDSAGGQILSYSLQGGTGTGLFQIDSSTGVVTVLNNSTLDYETTTSYTLLVRATDNGPGNLFYERLITVNVQDVNENTAPVIAAGGPFAIDENVGNNTNVGTISATDLQGDNITYSIVSGNTNTAFKINATTGLIQVNGTGKIDYEALSTYTLRIRATDNNALPLFSERNFVININNLNEGPSLQIDQVVNTLDLAVRYNPANGNFYKIITTTTGFNTALNNASNALLNGANGHMLTITSASENTFVDNTFNTNVWLAASDTETEGVWKWLAGPEAGSIFSLGGTATSGFYENWNGTEPNSGTANNNAYLNTNGTWYDQDLATNRAYVIEWESYDVINNRNYVLDYTAPGGSDIANGSIIGRVQAGDQDSGDTLTYSITSGNDDGIFEIDSVTGQLRILDNSNINTALQSLYALNIRVQDTAGLFDTKSINITFNQTTSIGTNETLASTEGAATTITTADLNIIDGDTAASNLEITITTQPSRGFIAMAAAPTIAITNFTQADLAANSVIYVHNGSETVSDSFVFSVSDGSSTISGQTFNIDVTPVNDAPVINVYTGATVLEGGNVLITNAMLSTLDADDAPSGLTYTLNTLTHGIIQVNGITQNTFTQADVNANLVRFVHDGNEGNGAFNVTVADGGENGAGTSTVNFTITATPVNDSPVILTNTGTTVLEGGNTTITTAMLSATDADDVVATLIYTLSGIQNGTVQLITNPGVPVVSFTQDDLNNNRVRFFHDGNENNARFNFSVADGGENGAIPATGTFILTKTAVNDAPTIGINLGSSVNQNSFVILKNSVLAASDSDDTGAGLSYTVTGTLNGQLEYLANPNVAITTFTQADIDNSLVIFRHSGPVGAANFSFTLADGGENGAGTASGTFNLTVDNINDSPSVATNIAQNINRGDTLTLTTTMLDSFDPDDFGADLTWTIHNLQSGIVRVNGVVQNTFTQAQLDSGIVTFTHDDSQTITAGFTATIADGGENGAVTDSVFFKLNITPENTPAQIDTNQDITLAEGGLTNITGAELAISDIDNLNWYNSSWQYRQGITIESDFISADLTDFVLLIDGSNFSSDFWSNVKNDGSDIVITLGDGTTKLSRELVAINRAAGTMELHVKIPLLSASSDTQLYIYYGNIAAAETNNAAAAFSGYSHVYHMNQINPVDVVGARNGVNNSGGTIVTGVLGNGMDFGGTGNIDIATINGAGIRTVSFWYNPDTDGGGDYGSILGSSDYNNGIRHTATNEIHLRRATVNLVSSTPDFDTNKHLIFSYDSAAGTVTLYENGILQDTSAFSGWYNFEFLVGISGATDRAIDGTIDEIRLTSNTLSASWAAAEYANQSNPSSFIKLSGQQAYQSQTLNYSISALPSHGTLFLDTNGNNVVDGGETLNVSSTFTQADIAANRLKYLHNGGETASDSFTFRTYDGSDYSTVQSFDFIITPVNDAPVLTLNTGLTMNEGATSTITASALSYSDTDNAAGDLAYTASNLSNGIIRVNGITQNTFTQADINAGVVEFIHDGSETLAAGFDFTLTDGDATITAQSFALVITPVNDSPVIATNTGATLDEGSFVVITTAMLNEGDPDDNGAGLTYTASALINGTITVNGITQNTFTQADIDAGLVRFNHDGSETLSASFDISLADGGENGATAATGTFNLTVTPVNDSPVIATNTGAVMNEGASLVITGAMLNEGDPDDSGAGLTYTASALVNGIITVNGITQNTFTQADIDAGLVVFVHNGGENLLAGFDISLSDGGENGATPATATFAISVTPVNDAPVINGWNLVSSENFESGASGWVNNTTTAGGTYFTRYLGSFSSDGGVQSNSKTYTLSGTQEYTVIEFDFLRLDSWDSEQFRIWVNDTQVFAQAFATGATTIPDGSFGNVSWTVSELTQITGNLVGGNSTWTDQIFQFTMTVQNDAAGSVKIGFGSTLNQGVNDESWGIDNVNIYEALESGTPGPFHLAENTANGQVVGRITAGDVEGDTITYSITGGTGAGVFAINSASGAITVINSAALNYEAITSFTLDVRATDNGSPNLFDAKTITINLIDVPENTAPVITTTGPFSVAENAANNTVIANMTATDAEGHALTWTITGGNTDNIFSITSGGQLRVNSNTNLNFEWDNQYVLSIQAQDNGLGAMSATRNITINITNTNETPTFDTHTALLAADPYLRYNAATGNYYKYVSGTTSYAAAGANAAAQSLYGIGGHIATITSAAENTYVRSLAGTASIWLAARDSAVEGVWRWEAGGSENAQQFWQGGGSGAGGSVQNGLYANWNGATQPDNAGGVEDNAIMLNTGFWNDVNGGSYGYVIEWEGAAVQAAVAALQNGPYSVAENSANGTSVGFLDAFDIDAADTLTYSLTGGTGSGLFAVNASTGEITVLNGTALNFENSNSYTLDVRVQDAGGLFAARTVTINLTDVNEAPSALNISSTSIDENSTNGTVIGTLSSVDPDIPDDTFTYTIQNDPDNKFIIVGNALHLNGALDYETATSHSVTIRTNDGAGGTFDQVFTINVQNINDAPTNITLSQTNIAEAAVIGTIIGDLNASDADLPGDTFTFTIINDPDSKFIIVGNQLRLNATLDYNIAAQHSVEIQVSDNNGGIYTRIFTIDVLENSPPTDITLDNNTVFENSGVGTVIGTLSADDIDGNESFTFTLVNNPGGVFAIQGNELRVSGAIDFETTPFIDIDIQVTDNAGNTFIKTFTLNVSDVSEQTGDIVSQNPNAPLPQNQQYSSNTFSNVALSNLHSRDIFRVSDIMNPEKYFQSSAFISAVISGGNNAANQAFYGENNQILRDNTNIILQNNFMPENIIIFSPLGQGEDINETEVLDGDNSAPDNPATPAAEALENQQSTLHEILIKLQNEELASNDDSRTIYANTIEHDFREIMRYQEQKQAALRDALLNI